MNKNFFNLALFFLVLGLTFSPTQPVRGKNPQDRLEELVEKGDRAARQARLRTRTETQLRKALNIYRQVLEIDPEHTHALNRLSLGYYMLAEAYLDYEDKKEAYQEGFNYGVRSLRTNPEFRSLHNEKGFSALKNLPDSVNNAHGLVWAAANLGMLAEWNGVMESLSNLPALVSLNRRVLEIPDAEGYLKSTAHSALGSVSGEVLTRMPLTFWQVLKYDFSWERTKDHFEKAIELAPESLGNYLSYAYYYAMKKDKDDLAKELLQSVINVPLGDTFPLMNRIANEKARPLIKRL